MQLSYLVQINVLFSFKNHLKEEIIEIVGADLKIVAMRPILNLKINVLFDEGKVQNLIPFRRDEWH